MFSVWPELFAFELVAVFLLRVTVAYFFLTLGIRLVRAVQHADVSNRWKKIAGMFYGIAHITVGLLLLVGLYTQPAALAGALLTIFPVRKGSRMATCEQHMQLLLFTISLSLIFFGAGIFAFDLTL